MRAWSSAMIGVALSLAQPAAAEVSKIRILNSFGLSFLPLMVVEQQKLVEREAKRAGLGDVDIVWVTGGTGNVATDALLSGNVDVVSTGATVLITIWAKTRGSLNVKGVSAFSVVPFALNTRDPKIRSVKDFTERNRIAVPGIQVSPQAVLLQMAAEQAFGPGQHGRLDPWTVTMTNPDGVVALLSGGATIDSHFTTPPFTYLELKDPAIHQVLSSTDVLGGPATLNLSFTTAKFHDENPKSYAAYLAALEAAIAFIRSDPQGAAEIYLKAMNDKKTPAAEIVAFLGTPETEFGTTPRKVFPLAQFMHRIGRVASQPESWRDLFFPEIHDRPGS
jgi:NitT/TauT family transport system substrate-binding protein